MQLADEDDFDMYTKCISEYNTPNDNLMCSYCNKSCKSLNSLIQHEIRCPSNPCRIPSSTKLTEYIKTNRKGRTKQNCEDIKKQIDTMQKKKDNGWVNPYLGRTKSPVVHINQEHNSLEIARWHKFLKSCNVDFPKYDISILSDGYIYVRKNYIHEGTSVYIKYEHVLLMETILGDNFDENCVVHHLDENKSNNDIFNLIVFKSSFDHVTYHNSSKAYLHYDDTSHKFSCESL